MNEERDSWKGESEANRTCKSKVKGRTRTVGESMFFNNRRWHRFYRQIDSPRDLSFAPLKNTRVKRRVKQRVRIQASRELPKTLSRISAWEADLEF